MPWGLLEGSQILVSRVMSNLEEAVSIVALLASLLAIARGQAGG